MKHDVINLCLRRIAEIKKEEEAERDEILDMEQLAVVAREMGVDAKTSPGAPYWQLSCCGK